MANRRALAARGTSGQLLGLYYFRAWIGGFFFILGRSPRPPRQHGQPHARHLGQPALLAADQVWNAKERRSGEISTAWGAEPGLGACSLPGGAWTL